MSNPSTVWASLSLPISPVGSIPFVSTDGATIITDVSNFKYIPLGFSLVGDGDLLYQLYVLNGIRVGYNSNVSTAASVTINNVSGRFKMGAGQTIKTIVNNCVIADSIVHIQMETADATMTRAIVVSSAGQFVVTGNAAATGIVGFTFTVTNTNLI